MNFFLNIFLISFIFLAIFIFEYQTLETNLKGQAEESLELLQKDALYYQQNIKNFNSHIGSLSENEEVKNQQKRQAQKKGNKQRPAKRPIKPAKNKKKTMPPKKRPIPPKKRPVSPKKKPITPNKKTRKIVPKNPNARKFVPNQHVEMEAVETEHKPKKTEETEHKPKKPEEIEHKPNKRTTKKPEVTESKIMKSTTENVAPRPSLEKLVEIKNRFYTQVNELRKRHHANPLVVNPEIAKEVQNFIDYTLENDLSFPEYTGPYGQEYYIIWNKDEFDPFEFWTSGSENFNYTDPEGDIQFVIFTQIIWKSTTDIGCGVNSNDLHTYFICRFSPKGNIPDQFTENVLPE